MLKRLARTLGVVVVGATMGCAGASVPVPDAPPRVDVSGIWSGTYYNISGFHFYGDMALELKQTGAAVTGSFELSGFRGRLEGIVRDKTLTYRSTQSLATTEFIVEGDAMNGYGRNAAGIPTRYHVHRVR